jgi:hypothetical protein
MLKKIKVTKDCPTSIFYKNSYEDVDYVEAKVLKKEIASNITLKKYNTKPVLTTRKKEDLLELCKKNFIPKPYKHFFENL